MARSWKRVVGAGARHRLVFVDRFLASVVYLRHGAAHHGCWSAGSALTAPRSPGPSAKSGPYWPSGAAPSPQAFACGRSPRSSTTSGPEGSPGIIDGTEIRVRGPAVGRKDREKFISGKNKQKRWVGGGRGC